MHALGPALTMAAVDSVLPVTHEFDPIPQLRLKLNTSGLFADATAATRYTTQHLLPRANRSVFSVQAPTNLPFLADAIVQNKMATFWMADMCNHNKSDSDAQAQHSAMEEFIEGSGHFDNTRALYYMGWYNHTREPNPEVRAKCALELTCFKCCHF